MAARLEPAAVRTSATHPITLSWVIPPADDGSGGLGLHFCPGKEVVRAGVSWKRDMRADLARLRGHFQVTTIVCLLNDYELRTYKVQRYGDSVKSAGLAYVQFPIVEMAAPESLESTQALMADLHRRIQRGETLGVHCRGGVGRAGTIAACLLIHMGVYSGQHAAPAAIKHVRQRRCPQAVESRRQESFIAAFAAAAVADSAAPLVQGGSTTANATGDSPGCSSSLATMQ